MIPGQQNMIRSLLTKLNEEKLTTFYTCKYLFLRLELFLHIRTPIFLTIPLVKKYVTRWKSNIFFNFFFRNNLNLNLLPAEMIPPRLNKVNIYNLGQKVGDKLTKLSEIGFSIEWFTADFLQFFTKKCQNLAFDWMTAYSPSNPSISGIFWKFPNFLRS